MADNFKYAQLQPFTLAGSGVSIGATTITLTEFLSIDGTPLTMSDFGTIGFGTIEPNGFQREEQICFTGVIQNLNGTATLTGVKSVTFLSPYTQTVGVSKSHPGGVAFVITNTSGFYDQFANKNNEETILQEWTFPSVEPGRPRLNADVDATNAASLITYGQLARAVFGAVPSASTTVNGTVELSTLDEQDDGTSVGGTGAFLVPQNSNITEARVNIVRFVAGENINTLAAPLAVYLKVSDGKVYRTDATSGGEATFGFIGIAVAGQNILANNVIRVQIDGLVLGYAALTAGANYFLTNTPGAISTTPGSTAYKIGKANSTATKLLLQPGIKSTMGQTVLTMTGSTTITTGFRPDRITILANIQGGVALSNSVGVWNSTGNYCTFIANGTSAFSTSQSWNVSDGIGNFQGGVVDTLTTTGFNLNNTTVGTPAGVGIIWIAEAN